MILDSGERTTYETGAVRDIKEGKGRMDLCPLDVLSFYLDSKFLGHLYNFVRTKEIKHLHLALDQFLEETKWDKYTAILKVSQHYEEGAKKYGEHNWEKGIPTHSYLDSACRHYIKWCRGDDDEPHDRAVIWNILGLIWTKIHHPECDDIKNPEENS